MTAFGASFSETFGRKQKHPPTELDKTSRSFTLMFLSVRTRQSQLKNLLDAADTPRRCPGKAEQISRDVHSMKILQFCWENKTCFAGHNLNQQQLRCWDKKGGTCQKETRTTCTFSLEMDDWRCTRYLQTHRHGFERVIGKMKFVKSNNSNSRGSNEHGSLARSSFSRN